MTALQRLLTRLDNLSYSQEETQVVNSIREHLISLLPIEREQIETAYSRGMLDGSDTSMINASKFTSGSPGNTPGCNYYERIYNTNIN